MAKQLIDHWNVRSVVPETIRSVRAIGLRRTFSVVRSRIEDLYFDVKHGTDTVQTLSLDEVSVESENRAHGQRYQPTGSSALGKILSRIKVGSEDVFVDFGCGKGRTLLLATRYPFKRVVGLEFSSALCDVARQNAAKFQALHPGRVEPQIVHTDAAAYEFTDDETVFYFFHPFGEPIMEAVIRQIEASLERRPRLASFLYYLPVHRNLVDACKSFSLLSEEVINGYECCVYQHVPSPRT